jgi:hypothetical protein
MCLASNLLEIFFLKKNFFSDYKKLCDSGNNGNSSNSGNSSGNYGNRTKMKTEQN